MEFLRRTYLLFKPMLLPQAVDLINRNIIATTEKALGQKIEVKTAKERNQFVNDLLAAIKPPVKEPPVKEPPVKEPPVKEPPAPAVETDANPFGNVKEKPPFGIVETN